MAILEIMLDEYELEVLNFFPSTESATSFQMNSNIYSYLFLDKNGSDRARWNWNSGHSDFWLHIRGIVEQDQTVDEPFLTLQGNGTDLFRLVVINSDCHWKVEYWNGSAWTQVGSTVTDRRFVLKQDTMRSSIKLQWTDFDIHIVMSDTVGVFDVYANRELMTSLGGGDTIFTAETAIDAVKFEESGSSNLLDNWWLAGAVVSDSDTREYWITESHLISNGALQDFSGDVNYCDEETWAAQTNTFISSDAANEISTFNMEGQTGPTDLDLTVVSVFHTILMRAVGASSLDGRSIVRKGGTNYSGSTHTLSHTWRTYATEYTTDPSTASAWADDAAIEAAEWGIESI